MPTPTAKYAIKAEDKSSAVIGKIKGKLAGLGGAFGGMGASIAGIVGVGGFGAMIKGSLDAADQMQKLSLQLGVSTEFLSEMRHAAGLTGTEFADLENGVRKLQKNLIDAKNGSKAMADAMEALGLNTEEVLKLGAEEQFLAVGAAIANLDDQALKTNVSMNLFGRAGGRLNQLFAGGADSISAMRAEAKSLGLTLSQDAANGAADANDAILRLQNAFKGAGQSLAIEMAGPIEQFADFIRESLIPALSKLMDWLSALGTAFGGIAAGVGAVFSGNFSEAGTIFGQAGSDLAASISGLFNGSSESPLPGTASQQKDKEQEKTRKAVETQTDVMKQIAKNTAKTGAAVAG